MEGERYILSRVLSGRPESMPRRAIGQGLRDGRRRPVVTFLNPENVSLRLDLRDEPRVVAGPTPSLEIAGRLHLLGGADVVSLVFCFPTASLRLGTKWTHTVDARVVRASHTWATRARENPAHMSIDFALPLPLGVVERVQAARVEHGQDLDVAFVIAPSLGLLVSEPLGHPSLVLPVYSNKLECPPLVLSRDRWLKVIGQLGFTRSVVIELPVHGLHSAEIADAEKHLLAARAAFAHGNIDDVGVRAFKAFEALVPARGHQQVFTAIKDAYLAAADPDVAEAALEMMTRLAKLYHIGGRHHAKGQSVARHHARFLLGAAEMVVAWCAEASSTS